MLVLHAIILRLECLEFCFVNSIDVDPCSSRHRAIANDNFDSAGIIKQLYPDQETYKKEEQRRFEILDAHWDLPIKDVDLDAR